MLDSHTTTNETLGDLLDQGYGLNGWCENCGKSDRIDVQQLTARLGRNFIWLHGNIGLKLRCQKCSRKSIQVNLAIPERVAG